MAGHQTTPSGTKNFYFKRTWVRGNHGEKRKKIFGKGGIGKTWISVGGWQEHSPYSGGRRKGVDAKEPTICEKTRKIVRGKERGFINLPGKGREGQGKGRAA